MVKDELFKEFVPYDRALRMKALGFDEPCFSFYMGGFKDLGKIKYVNPSNVAETNVLAPTFSQAFRWFDENTEWSGFIVPSKKEGFFDWWIHNYTDPNYLTVESDEWYVSRKEAELACIDKLIEIVERKNI